VEKKTKNFSLALEVKTKLFLHPDFHFTFHSHTRFHFHSLFTFTLVKIRQPPLHRASLHFTSFTSPPSLHVRLRTLLPSLSISSNPNRFKAQTPNRQFPNRFHNTHLKSLINFNFPIIRYASLLCFSLISIFFKDGCVFRIICISCLYFQFPSRFSLMFLPVAGYFFFLLLSRPALLLYRSSR
jgi:hypothetical protein